MANSTTKKFALYRCTNTGDTESNLPDADSLGADYGITDTSIVAVQKYPLLSTGRKTDVPTPVSQVAGKPDTGNASIETTITFVFNNAVSYNNFIGTLLRWQMDFQNSSVLTGGGFNKGRFGLRCDENVWFNFQPTIDSGWKIIEVKATDDIENGQFVTCDVTVQWWGKISDLIAAIVANGG